MLYAHEAAMLLYKIYYGLGPKLSNLCGQNTEVYQTTGAVRRSIFAVIYLQQTTIPSA